jgi:hypothetical protein
MLLCGAVISDMALRSSCVSRQASPLARMGILKSELALIKVAVHLSCCCMRTLVELCHIPQQVMHIQSGHRIGSKNLKQCRDTTLSIRGGYTSTFPAAAYSSELNPYPCHSTSLTYSQIPCYSTCLSGSILLPIQRLKLFPPGR